MNRPIVGFHRDAASDWVAELTCGHRQHVRHAPPFQERPWVLSDAGRAARIGTPLDCARCDRRELPEGWKPYRQTAVFTQETIPRALLERHTTKRGVWAQIHVARGRLLYRIDAPFHTEEMLVAGSRGVVLPEIEHCVAPAGEVEFFVEFWRRAQARKNASP